MEGRSSADGWTVEPAASLGDDLVEFGERIEIFIDDRFIDERPKAFRWLQLGTVGGQEDELDAVWNVQPDGTVPPGIVEDEDDDAVAPGADLIGELGEHRLEEGLVHRVRQIPDGFAAGGLDEGGQMKPLEAMMAKGDGTFADRRPDAAVDRLQSKPVLVRRPDFDRLVGMLRAGFRDRVGDVFLSVSCCSSVAARG